MNLDHISRRDFVKSSLSGLALASLPAKLAFGQTVTMRMEWQEFRTTPGYASFINAIATMRNNTNQRSRNSWRYWTNSHVNYCPHDIPYFLGWHRGYLYYFEQTLREVSGNSTLTVPYWDYYTNPTIPAEFINPATNNPLYVNRVNTNVYNALSLAPFAPGVFNFQRGTANAFETLIESAPHNPVHNIIGASMATMQSPLDPIFFLHHANVDRLWHAWALPDGEGMPWFTDTYWSGSFRYASNLTLPRAQTWHPSRVFTDYRNLTTPTALPPQTQAARIIRVQAQGGRALNRPPLGTFPVTGPRPVGPNRLALGGARKIPLAENSVSVSLPLQASANQSLQAVLARARGGPGQPAATPYQSVQIVLDELEVTEAGKLGGYYYNVYLNLPASGDVTSVQQSHLLGTVGPFEISAASHHDSTARLTYPATGILANLTTGDLKEAVVSLVRVSGQNTPKGQVLAVGEVRLEISDDPLPAPGGRSFRPPNGAYR